MGWASGSEIADKVWKLVSKFVPEKKKKGVARKLVSIFEEADCDTMYECEQLMCDAQIKDKEDE